MSLSSETARKQYTLTTTGQTLTVDFYFLDAADLKVVRTRSGADTDLTLTTHYTVANAGNPSGGSITLTGVADAADDIITIYRNDALTQPASYPTSGQFPSATVGQSQDRLTMLIQQLKLDVERSIRVPVSNAALSPLTKSTRAGCYVAFDESGNLLLDPGATIGAGVRRVTSKAAMTALNVSELVSNQFIHMGGFYSLGDGGEGIFYYASGSSATANGVTIFAPDSGTGRFFRLWDGSTAFAEWGGAKGDGSTDDMAAIQACINLFSGGNGTVRFGAKSYCISSALSISQSNMSLRGVNTNATKIRSTADSGGGIVATSVNRLVISDLTVDKTVTPTGGAGIELTNTTLALIEDVAITNFQSGIYMNKATNTKVSRVLLNINAGSITWRGIYVNSASGGSISSTFSEITVAVGAPYSGTPYGFYFDGISVRDLTIINPDIAGPDYGIYFDASGIDVGEVFTDIQIVNPIVDQIGATGIYLKGKAGQNDEDGVTILGGWVNEKDTGAETHGVYADDLGGLSIVGTQFTADTNWDYNQAVRLNDCSNVSITGAQFKANKYGVITSGACTDITVSDSVFRNPSGKTATCQIYFVGVTRGGIVNNRVNGYADTGISIDSGSDRIVTTGNTVEAANITNELVNNGTNGQTANNITT